jgi:hypothetical protein
VDRRVELTQPCKGTAGVVCAAVVGSGRGGVAGGVAPDAALHLLLDHPDMRADRDGILQGTLQTKVGLGSRAIQGKCSPIKGTSSLLL